MPICEKPLADTWLACREIHQAVTRANVKMERAELPLPRADAGDEGGPPSGELGRVNYVVSRFADDCREYDAWPRRHELPHAMLGTAPPTTSTCC